MATNSLHSIQHHNHSLIKRHHHSSETPPSTTSLFLKPTTINTNLTLSYSPSSSSNSSVTFSISQTASSSTPSTSQAISFDLLRELLSAKNFQQADEETRRLIIVLAGEAAQKRGYVFFSEVQFISETDLKTIDELWREHSDNKFGYSVQKRILEKVQGDFTKFFIKIGWMKKLDTEMEQYNYRSFPTEFMWELNDDTPEGHLPLTNALRGTQLLSNILNHPAFDAIQEEGEGPVDEENGALKGLKDNKTSSSKPLAQRVFKPDYSF
ncbi:GUN4-like [Sesbania bispinosa]|nr:GUN4-like [Sesbania bispinosa]